MAFLRNIVMFASNEGGHFAQMLALKNLFNRYKTVILTDNKHANFNLPELEQVEAIEYAMSHANMRNKLSKKRNKKLTKASYLGAYFGLFKECFISFWKHRPKVIISTGSNIAVPLCLISKIMGGKFVYIETRAKVYSKTLTGKVIGGLADVVIVQWPEMVDVYNGKAKYLGTLV